MKPHQSILGPRSSRRWAAGTLGSLVAAGLLGVSAGAAAAAGGPPPLTMASGIIGQPPVAGPFAPGMHPGVFQILRQRGDRPIPPPRPGATRFPGLWRETAGLGLSPNAGLMRFVAEQAAQLRLADTQYKAIQDAYQSLQTDLAPIAEQLSQARRELAKLWNTQPLDEAQILATAQKVTQLQIEVHKKIEGTAQAILATFSPEQKAQWQAWQKAQAQARAGRQPFLTDQRKPGRQLPPRPLPGQPLPDQPPAASASEG